MASLQKILFGTLKWMLLILLIGGSGLAILDEALKFLRARYNTKGTVVHGFALYERGLPPPAEEIMDKAPGGSSSSFIKTGSSVNFGVLEGRASGKTKDKGC